MDKQAIVSLLQPTLKTFFKIGKSSDTYDEFKDVFSSKIGGVPYCCLLYTSPSPRDRG